MNGYLDRKGDFLFASREGIALSDALGPQLISDEVARRMREWRDYEA